MSLLKGLQGQHLQYLTVLGICYKPKEKRFLGSWLMIGLREWNDILKK